LEEGIKILPIQQGNSTQVWGEKCERWTRKVHKWGAMVGITQLSTRKGEKCCR